jgi:hypothetical protein
MAASAVSLPSFQMTLSATFTPAILRQRRRQILLEPNENVIELTISLSVADADEFIKWCEDQGLTRAQGLNKLLLLANPTRSVGTFAEDTFNKAFAASRGKISPGTVFD